MILTAAGFALRLAVSETAADVTHVSGKTVAAGTIILVRAAPKVPWMGTR